MVLAVADLTLLAVASVLLTVGDLLRGIAHLLVTVACLLLADLLAVANLLLSVDTM